MAFDIDKPQPGSIQAVEVALKVFADAQWTTLQQILGAMKDLSERLLEYELTMDKKVLDLQARVRALEEGTTCTS